MQGCVCVLYITHCIMCAVCVCVCVPQAKTVTTYINNILDSKIKKETQPALLTDAQSNQMLKPQLAVCEGTGHTLNNQSCREVWWYIICAICSSSCWMASSARASVQSTQRAPSSWSHLAQLSSKFTLSQTAWEVWRLSWVSSDTTDCGGSAALWNKLVLKQLSSRQP